MSKIKENGHTSEKIFAKNGELLAIFVEDMESLQNLEFLSREQDSIQVGAFKYDSEHSIRRHMHNKEIRSSERTQELLYILSGEMKANIYDEDQVLASSINLRKGASLLLLSGWHDFEIPRKCNFFEVKTGPYLGARDKTVLED